MQSLLFKATQAFIVLWLLGCGPVAAQFKNIQLDSQGNGRPPTEPSITINFKNPDNVVGGSILDNIYTSFDGGLTWEKSKQKSTYGVYGDPVLLSDHKGNLYHLHLSDPEQRGWASEKLLDRIVCQRSTDGGKTWNNGGYMGLAHPKDQDKEWAIADPKTGHLYATWTEFDLYDSKDPNDKSRILFARSKNGGKKWSRPIAISQKEGDCIDDDNTPEGAVPAVGPNGQIYVAWSYNDTIWFDRSTDQGKTWLANDVAASTHVGGWSIDIPGINRCNGMPVTLCDLSGGPNHGTIYINFADQRNGTDDTDIWLVKSTDGGNTWSAPKRINDDAPGRQQFLTWMAIDQTTGYLYTVFYDRRNHTGLDTDVYLAWSDDGGESFTNVQISQKPFEPTDVAFFGDYNNIAAHAGRIHPIWTRMVSASTSIWTTAIKHQQLVKLKNSQ